MRVYFCARSRDSFLSPIILLFHDQPVDWVDRTIRDGLSV
jgi:hypothetical protein